MILPNDLDKLQTDHFHVQRCPGLFLILCLWLYSVDPFSCAQFVGYKAISIPKKSGCFLFKWDILHEMSQLRFCLTLANCSLHIFTFTQELWGINLNFMLQITSKRRHSPHHSQQENPGLTFHMFRPSYFDHHFCLPCPLHFKFSIITAQATKMAPSELLIFNLP